MSFTSIKTRLTLIVSLLVTLLIAATAFLALLFFEHQIKDEVVLSQKILLSTVTSQLDDRIYSSQKSLKALATIIAPEVENPAAARKTLDANSDILNFNNTLLLFSKTGALIAATPKELNVPGADFSFREYFKKTVETGRPYISQPFFSALRANRTIIMFTEPIFDQKGTVIAVLGGGIDISSQNCFNSLATAKIGKGGFFSLYGPNQITLIHPDRTRLLQKDTLPLTGRGVQGIAGSEEVTTMSGVRVIRSVDRLRSTGWVIAASYPVAEAYKPIYTARRYFIGGGIVAVFFSGALVWWVMKYLTAPLLRFTEHIQGLLSSETERSLVTISSRDEIGNLAKAFNRLLTELDRSNRTLAESQWKYKQLFMSNPNPMWVYDLETLEFLNVNNVAIRHYGYSREEFLAMTIKDIRPVEDTQALENTASVTEGIDAAGGWRHIKKDGTVIYVEITSHIILYAGRPAEVVLVNDISERRQAEEEKAKLELQLRHMQKMEALGTLTGGVAHDFNNILTAIQGFTKLALMQLGADSPQSRHLHQIVIATDKASTLVRGLLAYSRRQPHTPKAVDVNDIVSGIANLLARLIGEGIELSTRLAEERLVVMADAGQLEQVLMNLATNARDAMSGTGVLSISTGRFDLDDQFVRRHGYGEPGYYACLSISDTGVGMDASIMERIFEPFFTTKEVGKGTGLGLSILYGIMKQHNGYVTVSSAVGRGTTFDLYFPLISSTGAKPAAHHISAPRPGSEAILLVEDNDEVRHLFRELLQRGGYTVLDAKDGEEGVEKFSLNCRAVDLLIVDAIMPKKSGKEVYRSVRKLRDDLCVLYVSGYSAGADINAVEPESGEFFISKPVSPSDLLAKVREILDHPMRSHRPDAKEPEQWRTDHAEL